jgi:hypothetical protein
MKGRGITDAEFASATMTEQWALAKIELITSLSITAQILAERRCDAIENFIRENLTD